MRAIVLHALGNAVDVDIIWVELKNEHVLIQVPITQKFSSVFVETQIHLQSCCPEEVAVQLMHKVP